MKTPETLLEATRLFSDPEKAHDYLVKLRWPEGVIGCPTCGCSENYYLATQKRWKCKACKRQFSVKVGTIFEDSPITLDKWLIAIWLIVNAKNGISSCEIARSLGITQKSAWHLDHRIRAALVEGSFEKMSGTIEADETLVGGKKKRQRRVGDRNIPRGPLDHKTAVMGVLERGGKVRAYPIPVVTGETVQNEVRTHVEPGSKLYTDGFPGYRGMIEFAHDYVAHNAFEYVRGEVHTNTIENFWTLLKRCIKGTYVAVEPFHLARYCDEQAFRYNLRKSTDGERFVQAASQVAGKRLTYKALIGKEPLGAIQAN